MEISLNIELPEDFSTLCDIFGIRPELFVQKMLEEISLPYFYSNPHGNRRLATMLFLDHLESAERSDSELDFHIPYMEKLSVEISKILLENSGDHEIAEKTARKIMKEWHKAILMHRAKYIIDDMEGEK